jgi:Restriction endonuclease NotI
MTKRIFNPEDTKVKSPPSRYSIGEWFGSDITSLTAGEREAHAGHTKRNKEQACPFREGRKCSKKGGVCTVRRYEKTDESKISLGKLVTTCPARFFDSNEIFHWIGEVLLGTPNPLVVGEIPFLQKLKPDSASERDEEPGEGDFIGRIDSILVHPDLEKGLNWCALEMQAVYFSGDAMGREFSHIASNPAELQFPVGRRRPDFRSSGPKRLLPQLQTKVPELSRWGRKMAICVDESFFDELVGIEETKHLSNADLAWFIVRYEPEDGRFRLKRGRCVFSKLDSTVKALTGGVPLPKEVFENQIRGKIAPGAGFKGQGSSSRAQ